MSGSRWCLFDRSHFVVFPGVSVDVGSRQVLDLLLFLNRSQSTGYTYVSGSNNATAILLEGELFYSFILFFFRGGGGVGLNSTDVESPAITQNISIMG